MEFGPQNSASSRSLNAQTRVLSISVVIPTKDRHLDLLRTIDSLRVQTLLPLELIVVDQTADRLKYPATPFPVIYIHDPRISGASEARNRAMSQVRGDVTLFLDDDVILEPSFLEEISRSYVENVDGVCGVITNYVAPPLGRALWDRIFVCGPFCDQRQKYYLEAAKGLGGDPFPFRQFGGGLMSFRTCIARQFRFDESLAGYSLAEDLDYCAQLPISYRLVMAPRARLIHLKSPSELRGERHWLAAHGQSASYLFYRHWKNSWIANCAFVWLTVGQLFVGAVALCRNLTLGPLRDWRWGRARGRVLALEPSHLCTKNPD